MKNILKHFFSATLLLLLCVATNGCHKADPEFAHNDNLIHKLSMMKSAQQDAQLAFTIDEYDAQGNLVTEDITPERVAGGYGMAKVSVPFSMYDDVDLTSVYLSAEVTYDAIITPGLIGLHDISGDGIVISVKAGNGRVRKYRVYGQFE